MIEYNDKYSGTKTIKFTVDSIQKRKDFKNIKIALRSSPIIFLILFIFFSCNIKTFTFWSLLILTLAFVLTVLFLRQKEGKLQFDTQIDIKFCIYYDRFEYREPLKQHEYLVRKIPFKNIKKFSIIENSIYINGDIYEEKQNEHGEKIADGPDAKELTINIKDYSLEQLKDDIENNSPVKVIKEEVDKDEKRKKL